jgi:hypothetical protein
MRLLFFSSLLLFGLGFLEAKPYLESGSLATEKGVWSDCSKSNVISKNCCYLVTFFSQVWRSWED